MGLTLSCSSPAPNATPNATNGRALMDQWPQPVADLPDEYFEALLLRLYVGNLTASGLFTNAPLNTDNHPLIEYLAPRPIVRWKRAIAALSPARHLLSR